MSLAQEPLLPVHLDHGNAEHNNAAPESELTHETTQTTQTSNVFERFYRDQQRQHLSHWTTITRKLVTREQESRIFEQRLDFRVDQQFSEQYRLRCTGRELTFQAS